MAASITKTTRAYVSPDRKAHYHLWKKREKEKKRKKKRKVKKRKGENQASWPNSQIYKKHWTQRKILNYAIGMQEAKSRLWETRPVSSLNK